mmetsp:Transcript_2801/g.4363  ORF Transcript_2801/g.4363 Transcript_2801/m.4363 type:complete len:201 (+) Transcript_2801:277-879(+)
MLLLAKMTLSPFIVEWKKIAFSLFTPPKRMTTTSRNNINSKQILHPQTKINLTNFQNKEFAKFLTKKDYLQVDSMAVSVYGPSLLLLPLSRKNSSTPHLNHQKNPNKHTIKKLLSVTLISALLLLPPFLPLSLPPSSLFVTMMVNYVFSTLKKRKFCINLILLLKIIVSVLVVLVCPMTRWLCSQERENIDLPLFYQNGI